MKKSFIVLTVLGSAIWAVFGFLRADHDGRSPLPSDTPAQTIASTPSTAGALLFSSAHQPASAASPSGNSQTKANGIEAVSAALKSIDQLVVREQLEVLRNCTAVSRRQDELMLLAAGIFDKARQPRSQTEQMLVMSATKRVLDECRDFLPLGIVALTELTAKLNLHGKSLGSPLFTLGEDIGEQRLATALLLSSTSPTLVEAGIYELVRGIQGPDEHSPEKTDAGLWDRALMIAGCQLGKYCSTDSIQSQRLCLQSRLCNTSIRDYWLQDLPPDEVSQVNERADLLEKWLRSPAARDLSRVVHYQDLAKAVGK